MAEISRALEGESQTREVVVDAQGMEAIGKTQWQIAWRRFRRHKMAIVGLFVLVVLYLGAIFAPLVAPYDPDTLDLENLRQGPSLKHLMGTDALGRDLFSRVVYGGRISLSVGIGVSLSAGIIGTTIGALAGYYGRFLDAALMRTTDFFLAMPFLVVLMMGAKALGGSVFDILLVVSLVTWMPVARIVRGVFLSIKEREYIEAARAMGAGGRRIIVRHMLPNALGPIIVNVTLTIALAILVESTLSFLGFGIQPPTATWGNMVAGAKDSMVTQPWIMLFPGLMIFITVLCVNFLGDGLRDALDPTTTRVRA
jgi:peptide/nickel transport system permease protein